MTKKHDNCCGHDHGHDHDHAHEHLPVVMIGNAVLARASLIETVFEVAGMDCADEVAAIQAALRHDEISEVNANLMAGTVTIRHLPSLGAAILKAKVESAGVRVRDGRAGESHSIPPARALLVAASGLLAGSGLLLPAPAARLAFLGAVAAGGALVFPKALRSLRQLRLDINVLMTIAAGGAIAIGESSEAAMVVFLFALSEALESFSVGRARRAIREVMDLAPPTALLLEGDDRSREAPLSSLRIGDVVLVKSGARIPVDGVVRRGTSLVNQAPLTGEALPVSKGPGASVLAGTLNEAGALEVEATRLARDTKAAQILRMVEEAQREKAPAQRFVDSFARYYTPLVFVGAAFVFVVPPLFLQGAWGAWLYRALVLLVIACPCALVISTPVSIVSGLAAMARRGVLVKGGVYLELLGKIRAVALDKTGTVTYGRPRVRSVHVLNGASERELLEVAVSLEASSGHPLARAIEAYAREQGVAAKPAGKFQTVVGYGVEAELAGHRYFLGNHRFAHDTGVCRPELEALLDRLEAQALSVVVIGHKPHESCAGEALGVIAVGDEIRENAARSVAALRAAGVRHVAMLTGDNRRTALSVAERAGIADVKSDLLPEDKAREMKRLVAEHGTVAMVGDGINDAPALAEASLGVAMGVAGADAAIETADIALMRDDLEELAVAIRQGRRVLSVIRFNIGAALAVKAVFLGLALLDRTNLWFAVAADTGTSLLVVANALRLLRVAAPKAR